MNTLYNVFFSHSDSLQGLMLDTVIFFGMLDMIVSFVRVIIHFGNGRRL